MKKHQYFTEETFDKLYTELKRSKKLDWNAKALITHIINWQEKKDKKTGRQLVCTESNTTISEALGIPASTLNKLITRLGKETPFFKAEPKPRKRPSGSYFNGTRKTVNMESLMEYIREEQMLSSTIEHEAIVNSETSDHTIPNPISEEIILANDARANIRNQVTKEHAYEQLTNVLCDISGVFLLDKEEIELQLRLAVMNRINFSDREKVVYSEWVETFMQEEFEVIRTFFDAQQENGKILTA